MFRTLRKKIGKAINGAINGHELKLLLMILATIYAFGIFTLVGSNWQREAALPIAIGVGIAGFILGSFLDFIKS